MTIPSVTCAQGYCPSCEAAAYSRQAVALLRMRLAFDVKSPSPRAELSRRVYHRALSNLTMRPDGSAARRSGASQSAAARAGYNARPTPLRPLFAVSPPTHPTILPLLLPALAICSRQMRRVHALVSPPSYPGYRLPADALRVPPRCSRPPRSGHLLPADARALVPSPSAPWCPRLPRPSALAFRALVPSPSAPWGPPLPMLTHATHALQTRGVLALVPRPRRPRLARGPHTTASARGR